jgi:P63C domain-containing protein
MITKEQAQNAARARWDSPKVPKATHSGILMIGGQEIACDVLEDGKRVLRQKTFLKAIGRGKVGGNDLKREDSSNLPIFLKANNLIPYLEGNIADRAKPIKYRGPNNQRLNGYDATLLPETCKIYVKAEEEGALQGNQIKIAKVCKSILYGLATVGIISLVDECTNYVEQRNRNELQELFEKYVSEEMRPWTRKFPNEFFKQIYRLYDWNYYKVDRNKHPRCVGNMINKYIYDRLPIGIKEELQKKNPIGENGFRKHRHHQFLTEDIGEKNLNKQIMQTLTLMRVADNFEDFERLFEKISPNEVEEI